MYCFHCFDFINVIIFAINLCGPYSRLVGEKSDVTVFFNHLDPYLLTSDQSLVILPKLLLLLLLFSSLVFQLFAFNAESFAIVILVFILPFFLLVTFSGRTSKSFLGIVLTLVITKTCDQDLTHSSGTSKHISTEIVPQVVICGMCGT